MKILHIAAIGTEKFFGVNIAVPKIVNSQKTYAEVALLNTLPVKVDSVKKQFNINEIKRNKMFFSSYDVVVFHEPYVKEYPMIARKLVHLGIPYIIVPHSELMVQAQNKKWLKKKVANLLYFGSYFRHAMILHCLSQKEYAETKFAQAEFISPNGIACAEKKKDAFSSQGLKFIYVGRLDKKMKGIDLMLNGICIIKQELLKEQVSFDIYGPNRNGQAEEVKKLIYFYGLEKLVVLHKEILGEEKINTLLQADVFLQTSRAEGMPLGVLEALSIGLPCLLTEGTCLAETVQNANAGWGVKTNAEAIAKGIQAVIKEKEKLAEKSENAIRLTEETFTWDKIAKKTIQRYGELIGQDKEG